MFDNNKVPDSSSSSGTLNIGCGMNSIFSTTDAWAFTPSDPNQLKTTNWVVLMHSPGIGTFAPSFPNIDEAEEFSNAMRVCNEDMAISEPIPVVKTETIKVTENKTQR